MLSTQECSDKVLSDRFLRLYTYTVSVDFVLRVCVQCGM